MKDWENLVVKRDDLTIMINALENMQKSLTLLSSSLAGLIPRQISPAQLQPIAGNLISSCLPDIPYNIYTYSTEAYSEELEATIRRFLLLIPAIPSILTDSIKLDCIDLRIEEEASGGTTILVLGFTNTVTDSEKKRFGAHWEKLPERIREEFLYKFSSSANSLTLSNIKVKKEGGINTKNDYFD